MFYVYVDSSDPAADVDMCFPLQWSSTV